MTSDLLKSVICRSSQWPVNVISAASNISRASM